ncbi:hypothetical protein H9X96_03180 [Pedobacter sp. N36a]|uniref:hypothetical protein n=1 Tax=Pedobacter sp. N36a TaxID=2767996 RepID=UPI001656957C|nr:hypothetical protein [Pedobacter sp. N36a]MBC8984773.1 hypothetical protein [Pedobacter sp. N36a]
MTIKEKMGFIMDNESPTTFKQAKELAKHQWDVIVYLMDQKKETFAMYKELEDHHIKLQAFVQKQMIEDHKPDKLPN